MAATSLPQTLGSDAEIAGGLQDALVEALVLPPDPRARSAVIFAVVQEMQSIVECLDDSDAGPARVTDHELTSMQQLSIAAHDHRLRMTDIATAAG